MSLAISLNFVFKVIVNAFCGYLLPFFYYFTNETPEKVLLRTLRKLQQSIGTGDIKNVKKIIDHFHQNLAENKQILSAINKSNQIITQTDLILAACQNKQADILYYILHGTDILVHLPDNSFDDTAVNNQRTEAIRHALRLNYFNMVEMLYDFWCGNLHWSGHNIKNIDIVGNILQNARDACPNDENQLQANVHCLITFNAFQCEVYNNICKLNKNNVDAKETAKMILIVLKIYDKYSQIEMIRRQHTIEEREQAIKANIADNSSTFYKNLEYIYYEVYFRKIDFNVALLILENVFVIRDKLKRRVNKTDAYFINNPAVRDLYVDAVKTYEELESEIYHFIYCTSENWRLYLPENRRVIIEQHTYHENGRKRNEKLTIDEERISNGPVIYLERDCFKGNIEKLKEILEKYVIRDLPEVHTQNEKKILCDNWLQTVSYLRDHYSLMKIVYYIEAIEKTANVNVVMIERVLHVVGEMLKSTEDSHHLSRSTQALLQTAISVETVRHLHKIRDFLSHMRGGELSARIKIATTHAQTFEEIKRELIMIKENMKTILDIFKSIVDKSLLEKGFGLLQQRIEDLPNEAKQRVDDIYDRFKRDGEDVVDESGKFYRDEWRPIGLSLQLLQEIPWTVRNKEAIHEKVQSAKQLISDKVVSILPSIIPNVRQMLERIIQNYNNNVKTFNQEMSKHNISVQIPECPDDDDIKKIKKQVKNVMKRNRNLKIDLGLLDNVENYKDHWESVKGMLLFCLTECEVFAPIKGNLTDTTTTTEAYDILTKLEDICDKHISTLAWRLRINIKFKTCWRSIKSNRKQFTGIETLHNHNKTIKASDDPRQAREELISCLISRLDLLKQTLLYPQDIPLSQLVQRFDHDVEFRITTEMALADVDNILAESNIKLMNKPCNLLRGINLGNVLDHGNPFLEVIGDIFNSHDLAAGLLDKAMMFAKDAESIEALYHLFKGKMNYRTILAGDLLQMNNQQKQQYKQFKKTSNWEHYELLARYPIPRTQRQNIQP